MLSAVSALPLKRTYWTDGRKLAMSSANAMHRHVCSASACVKRFCMREFFYTQSDCVCLIGLPVLFPMCVCRSRRMAVSLCGHAHPCLYVWARPSVWGGVCVCVWVGLCVGGTGVCSLLSACAVWWSGGDCDTGGIEV